jgi:hypothetical protein
MNQCRRVSELFFDMCDGNADSESKKVFHEHVRKCASCNEEFELYGLTVQALGSLERIKPPDDFIVQLRVRLDTVDSPSYLTLFRSIFSAVPRMPMPIGVATLAVVLVFGFFLYNESLTDMGAKIGYDRVVQQAPPHLPGQAAMPGTVAGPLLAKGREAGSNVTSSPVSPHSQPALNFPRYSMAPPNLLTGDHPTSGSLLPTLADRIGADNLTVESPSIDAAIESLKRILPNLSGKLVEIRPQTGVGEFMLGVSIPSKSYGQLTSELINHGAVEAGAGSGVTPPRVSEDGEKNVYLYIRFLPPR